jgi:hypothetical protein
MHKAIFLFDTNFLRMKKYISAQSNIGGVEKMTKKGNQNKNPRQNETEKSTGYGDKKLEGPNRPAE